MRIQVRSTSVKPPRIKECTARLECKVVDIKEAGDHTLFIGKPVLHLGRTFFTTAGEIVDLRGWMGCRAEIFLGMIH